ncbi:regulatory protein RecX [Arsenicicoccus dermatophilus]|uniref:regulatory protein RecX n=1 Tax=Arsenicicoccus dermatophilus TaxID=1076331 RepID=UPI0030C65CDE
MARAREALRLAESGIPPEQAPWAWSSPGASPPAPAAAGRAWAGPAPAPGPVPTSGSTTAPHPADASAQEAEASVGPGRAGVPDFLPADVAPATWEDLGAADAPDSPAPGTARVGGGGGADRRGGRGTRRGRPAQEPPHTGAAAVDAEPDHEDVARQIVLRQLAMASRSRAQLAAKLRQRDCPEDVIERVLDRMTEVGLVDDEAYAGMLVRTRQATKGLARRALAHELRTKGIDQELAVAALEEIDPDEERRVARRLVDKKLRTMGGLGADVQTRRLAGMLARKGYSGDVAYAVIRDAIADAPEHRRD